MVDITLKYNLITSIGFVTCNVPDDVMAVIKEEVHEIQQDNFKTGIPHNYTLAGAIEHEYSIVKSIPVLSKFFKHIVPEYWKLNNNPAEADVPYVIDNWQVTRRSVWVNFQKKYEFNPLHRHTGTLSFVLYVKIPYNVTDEINQPHNKKIKEPILPGISFTTPSIDGASAKGLQITDVPLDSQWENTMIIFPSWMHHQVAPFYTSDEYRISIAGNLIPNYNG